MAVDFTLRIIKGTQFRIQQLGRPAAIVGGYEPALLRIVHERAVGAGPAKVKMGPEIMGAEPLEKFAERAGTRRQFRRAFAIGKQHRAIMVAHVHRPDCLDRIEPGRFVQMKPAGGQLGLHGGDGRFERSVFARDKAFGLHEKCLE